MPHPERDDRPEETLDPADWDAFRALAHRMVDDTLDHLATLRDRAPWQPMPDAVRTGFDEPLPRRGEGEAAAYDQFPLCVIGTAGTVNTGGVDDLDALADFCEAEGLWFHVDGAYGAWACASDALRPLVAGMERADSLGFDLHKWGYLPFECACVLVRDAALHRATFATLAPYLAETERGVMAGGLPFADRGVDLTRGFKALKVWMSLKAHGLDALVRLVEQNVAQARYLAARVEASPSLELLAPVTLNVVCFRYAPADLPEPERNAVNEEILLRLQEDGIAVPSGTVLDGRYAIRAAIVNHRSRREDFDVLADAVERIGREVVEESGSPIAE